MVVSRLCLMIALLTLAGCSNIGFYWQAARGQLDLLSRRVPVETVLADEAVALSVRAQLRVAWQARQFAASDLALPDNKSYQTYADLEREYALWNVFAAPEFSVQPKTWCFPFAGCVGYRGYFSEQAAQREMHKLRAQGYDAFFGGVAAYSTLGRFADPILNTMLHEDDLRVVSVIFHELAHQVTYRPNDAAFSESFASFVEREGVRRYLAAGEAGEDYARYIRSLRHQREFAELVVAARESLAALYARELKTDKMREQKRQAFVELRERYAQLKRSWGGYAGYDGWFERDLNNAHLTSVSTYQQWVPAFREMLHEHAGDLAAFYAAVQVLADKDNATVVRELERLAAASGAGSEPE